jgi:1-acyl-sn-glycerol-3-phosphate acyltransferase
LYRFLGYIAIFLFKVFARFQVIGKENIPKGAGFVYACTHAGWLDVVALALSIFPVRVHYMAKKELFQNPIAAKFITSLNAFPVDRENPAPSSIKIPVQLVKEGKVVGIFPSGTRKSEDVPLKRGAITIASLAKAPIVPAYYEGPKTLKELFKGKKAYIVIGKPIRLEREGAKRVDAEHYTRLLSETFLQLKEELKNYRTTK